MTDVRELAGMLLLVIGSVGVGYLLHPIVIGGLKVLTPMEAAMLADSGVALAIGAWLMLVKKKP